MKHLCLAHQDEELELYLEECGLEGYGFWWLLLEHIGAPLEPGSVQCWQSHSEGKWAQILHVSTRGFRKFSNSLAVRKLILIENFDDSGLKRLKISIPNLLKYRDEYTSRSGETREKQPTSIGSRADTEQIQSRADTEQTGVEKATKAVRSRYGRSSDDFGFESLRAVYREGKRPTTEKNWVDAATEIINCGISDKEIQDEVVPWVTEQLDQERDPRRFYSPATLFKLDIKPWRVDKKPQGAISQYMPVPKGEFG
jgi:hypothetical protein